MQESRQKLPTVPIGKLKVFKEQINRIHSDREELKRELILLKEREPNLQQPPSILSDREQIRTALIYKLEAAITILTEKGLTGGQDLTLSKQALQFLK